LMHRTPGRQRPFASYIILTVVMAVLLLGVASFETWVTPAMMRWVTPMLLPV
jgi:stage II sporulation protein M